jgi:uncharacterized protein YggE
MRKRNPSLVVVVTLLLGVLSAESQPGPADSANRTIAVSVEGHASSVADEGTLHVGFAVYGPDSATAYARGAKISTEIIEALTQAGVQRVAIESETQSISQTTPDQLDKLSSVERTARAYRLQQNWSVKVPAEQAGQLLGIAVKAGANDSGAIDWSMRDPLALHTKATEDAMSRAKATAMVIAQGMGVILGPLISAANRAPALLPGELDTAAGGGQSFGYGGGLAGGGGGFQNLLALRPRKIEDTATVSAIYAVQ